MISYLQCLIQEPAKSTYFKFSATQALYLKSEIGAQARPIKSIELYYEDSVGVGTNDVRPVQKDSITIYMGHTTKTSFSVADDYIRFNQMQVVYTGAVSFNTNGWQTIELDSEFNYDGNSNLVVAVVDKSGNYDGSYYRGKMGHASTTGKMLLYYQSDNNVYNESTHTFNVADLTDGRPRIRFNSCFAPCTAPTLSLASISTTSANFTWTATSCSGTAYGRYEIEYGPAGFSHSEGTSQYVNGGTTAQISGLSDGVNYKAFVRVVDNNGNAKSEWSNAIEFSTNTCDVPQNVTRYSQDATTATITWTAALNGTGMYEVEYGPRGFAHGSGTTRTVGATNIQLTGLSASEIYAVYVRTVCSGDSKSNWSSPAYIHNDGIEDINSNAVTIYPNPTSEKAVVSLTGIEGTVNMSVVDMNGRLIHNATVECNGDCTKTIEVNGLAKGMYFIRINGENIDTVKRLMVK